MSGVVPTNEQALARLQDYIRRLGGQLPEGWSAVVVHRNPSSRTFAAHPADTYFMSPEEPHVRIASMIKVAEKLGLPIGPKARALTRATSYTKPAKALAVKRPDSDVYGSDSWDSSASEGGLGTSEGVAGGSNAADTDEWAGTAVAMGTGGRGKRGSGELVGFTNRGRALYRHTGRLQGGQREEDESDTQPAHKRRAATKGAGTRAGSGGKRSRSGVRAKSRSGKVVKRRAAAGYGRVSHESAGYIPRPQGSPRTRTAAVLLPASRLAAGGATIVPHHHLRPGLPAAVATSPISPLPYVLELEPADGPRAGTSSCAGVGRTVGAEHEQAAAQGDHLPCQDQEVELVISCVLHEVVGEDAGRTLVLLDRSNLVLALQTALPMRYTLEPPNTAPTSYAGLPSGADGRATGAGELALAVTSPSAGTQHDNVGMGTVATPTAVPPITDTLNPDSLYQAATVEAQLPAMCTHPAQSSAPPRCPTAATHAAMAGEHTTPRRLRLLPLFETEPPERWHAWAVNADSSSGLDALLGLDPGAAGRIAALRVKEAQSGVQAWTLGQGHGREAGAAFIGASSASPFAHLVTSPASQPQAPPAPTTPAAATPNTPEAVAPASAPSMDVDIKPQALVQPQEPLWPPVQQDTAQRGLPAMLRALCAADPARPDAGTAHVADGQGMAHQAVLANQELSALPVLTSTAVLSAVGEDTQPVQPVVMHALQVPAGGGAEDGVAAADVEGGATPAPSAPIPVKLEARTTDQPGAGGAGACEADAQEKAGSFMDLLMGLPAAEPEPQAQPTSNQDQPVLQDEAQEKTVQSQQPPSPQQQKQERWALVELVVPLVRVSACLPGGVLRVTERLLAHAATSQAQLRLQLSAASAAGPDVCQDQGGASAAIPQAASVRLTGMVVQEDSTEAHKVYGEEELKAMVMQETRVPCESPAGTRGAGDDAWVGSPVLSGRHMEGPRFPDLEDGGAPSPLVDQHMADAAQLLTELGGSMSLGGSAHVVQGADSTGAVGCGDDAWALGVDSPGPGAHGSKLHGRARARPRSHDVGPQHVAGAWGIGAQEVEEAQDWQGLAVGQGEENIRARCRGLTAGDGKAGSASGAGGRGSRRTAGRGRLGRPPLAPAPHAGTQQGHVSHHESGVLPPAAPHTPAALSSDMVAQAVGRGVALLQRSGTPMREMAAGVQDLVQRVMGAVEAAGVGEGRASHPAAAPAAGDAAMLGGLREWAAGVMATAEQVMAPAAASEAGPACQPAWEERLQALWLKFVHFPDAMAAFLTAA